MPRRTFTPPASIDLAGTIRFRAAGPGDPSIAISPGEAWIACRTPEGPATVHLTGGDRIDAEAWGPGAGWALGQAPATIGALDDPSGFRPDHPVLRRLVRRHPGLRITRSGLVTEMLLRTIVSQRVTGKEANRSYVRMIRALGDPAPGPRPLLLPPDPERVAASAYTAFHPWGIERARAEVLIRVAARARRMEEAAGMPLPEAHVRLTAVAGVGPWTAAKVALVTLGDPDAVPVGDYHLPNSVAWALAGQPRGDDARMLGLLEEYRPHRGRVVRLIQAGHLGAPKYGPRAPLRSIEGL